MPARERGDGAAQLALSGGYVHELRPAPTCGRGGGCHRFPGGAIDFRPRSWADPGGKIGRRSRRWYPAHTLLPQKVGAEKVGG